MVTDRAGRGLLNPYTRRGHERRMFGRCSECRSNAVLLAYAITEAPTVLLKNDIRKSHFRHALAGSFLLF